LRQTDRHYFQLKIEDMKIILDQSSQQQDGQGQQFVIINAESLANKSKMDSDDTNEGQEEIVYVLKEDNSGEQSNVIQLDSNCVNQEQFLWIANDQATDGTQVTSGNTVYTIKELNYAQVR
jgi:hypothetical protein